MKPVTDPSLLEQLDHPTIGAPVKDPALLSQLEGDSGDYWGDVKKNAVEGVKQFPSIFKGNIEPAAKIARAIPGGFMEAGTEMLQGKPFMQTHMGQAVDAGANMVKGAAEGAWQGAKDLGNFGLMPVEHYVTDTPWSQTQGGKNFRERPISSTVGAATTAIPMFEGARAAMPLAARGADAGAMALGRRALGFSKRYLNTEGKEANANAATRTALDEEIIKPFATGESMMESAKGLQSEYGKQMGSIFKEQNRGATGALGPKAKPQMREQFLFDPTQAVQELEALRPKTKSGQVLNGGDYAAQNEALDNAIETIKAHGDRPIPWDQANDLKSHLQGLANYDQAKSSNVNALRKSIGGVFKDSLDRQLAEATEASGGDTSIFGKSKKNWKAAHDMRAGLQNKISSEAGNNAISIGDMAAGALGGVVGGHFGPEGSTLGALSSMAARKLAGEYGASTGAYALNKAAKGIRKISGVADQIHNAPASIFNKGKQMAGDERGSLFPEGKLPEVQPGSKTGQPHALLAYEDKFGPNGSTRRIYNVFGDPNHPVFKNVGWGSSLTEDKLKGIPIVGKEPPRGPRKMFRSAGEDAIKEAEFKGVLNDWARPGVKEAFQKQAIGSLIKMPDGTFFLNHDLLRIHPEAEAMLSKFKKTRANLGGISGYAYEVNDPAVLKKLESIYRTKQAKPWDE